MKNSTAKKLFIVVEAVLGITAIILLLISMFGNIASNYPLTIGLGCVGMAGILNTVYLIKSRKESK